MPDLTKSTQFGGRNDFEIVHGGAIRESFDIESTTQFDEGGCIELNTTGEVQKSTGQTTKLTGITDTRRVLNNFEDDQTIGSGKATMILDQAVVKTVEFASGLGFLINDKVYNDGNGGWTNVAGSDTRVYGTVLADAVYGEKLEFFYKGAQEPA